MPELVGTLNLTWTNIYDRAYALAEKIAKLQAGCHVGVYGIPRGGIPAAQAVHCHLMSYNTGGLKSVRLVDYPTEASVFIDDIIDSGATSNYYHNNYPGIPFFALVDKQKQFIGEKTWVSFPWERMIGEQGPEENVRRLIEYVGDDPSREGLLETPARVIKALKEMLSGYDQNVEAVMKTFKDGACDEMVVLRDIEFTSVCEHHMLPFMGTATIAYVPDGRIIGVSKLARLLDIYSRRLQVQERLTTQITTALEKYLRPLGTACVIKAIHLCMTCRGVRKYNAQMITSSLTGCFKDKSEARSEFLGFAR